MDSVFSVVYFGLMSDLEDYNRITDCIIGAAIEVHRHLGPGLLVGTYRRCLAHEMSLRGLQFHYKVALPVYYKDLRITRGYRVDFLVESAILVQVKAFTVFLPIHEAEILAYLRLSHHRVGLILNFHALRLKDGIYRYVV